MEAWRRIRQHWDKALLSERLLCRSTEEPWPEVRALHLRSQHRTIPFVVAVNLVFACLTVGVFRDSAGWSFAVGWLLLHVAWAVRALLAWWRRRQQPHLPATPRVWMRVLWGTLMLSLLWSVAIWVWYGHADVAGRSVMVAIVVGNLCVGALALSSMATAVWTYLLPLAVATAASLLHYPQKYVAFEMLALALYIMVLVWFGGYLSRLITDHVLAERRLRISLNELELARDHLHNSEKLASLGSLVAGVSHEVNTPLGVAVTACSAVSDTLQQMHENYARKQLTQLLFEQGLGQAIEGVDMLSNNLNRAARLVASFKQTAVDQVDDRLCEFELMETVRTLLISLTPVMRRVPVQPQLHGPQRLLVRSYPSALLQILTNLLINSVSHAFEGVSEPTVSIEVADQGDRWVVLYRDNGVGVPPAVQARIFEPFFTTRRGRGGTGLGLNIVHSLVTQKLGGVLTLWSDVGAGVRFLIDCPHVPNAPAASEEQGPAP